VKGHFAHCGRRVDCLGQRNEVDSQFVKFVQGRDEHLHASREAVKFPHKDNVKFSLAAGLEQFV
jgi:hypothetical protein